jgi:hypothetical protein
MPVPDATLISRVAVNSRPSGTVPDGMRHYRALTDTGTSYEA